MFGEIHLPHQPHNLKRSQGLEAAADEGELISIWEGLSHLTFIRELNENCLVPLSTPSL